MLAEIGDCRSRYPPRDAIAVDGGEATVAVEVRETPSKRSWPSSDGGQRAGGSRATSRRPRPTSIRPCSLARKLEAHGAFWSLVEHININALGFIIVGLFVTTWIIADADASSDRPCGDTVLEVSDCSGGGLSLCPMCAASAAVY